MNKRMCKKKHSFLTKDDISVNDLVFAQMRGYSYWPAIISEIGRTVRVRFYGSNNR